MSERLSILLGLNYDSENEMYEDLSSDSSLEDEEIHKENDHEFYKKFLNNFKNSNLISKAIKLVRDRKKIPPQMDSSSFTYKNHFLRVSAPNYKISSYTFGLKV